MEDLELPLTSSQDVRSSPKATFDQKYEVDCFEMLLCSVYGDSYDLTTPEQLLRLTEMADYYRCLPALSRSLDRALIHSPNFKITVPDFSCDLLICAMKLRNALLFRESLIWAVCSWEDPSYTELETTHQQLFKIAKSAYNEIGTKIAKLQLSITNWMLMDKRGLPQRSANSYDVALEAAESALWDEEILDDGFKAPEYFRRIMESHHPDSIDYDLENLLVNNLVLGQNYSAGKEPHQGNFLCGTINDEDLPWDPTEKEW